MQSSALAIFRQATPRDLAWVAVVALVLALSPVTGAKRLLPAVVLGAVAGAVVLVARLRRRAREGVPPRGPVLARPPLGVGVVLGGALVLFAPTLVWLYAEYTESIWRNPHGLFVPFFAILLARHRLRDDPDPRPRASAWGFACLVPACLLAMLDAGIRSHYLALAGLLLALPGLSLLLLGAERTRRIAFPLAFCLFLVPLPQGLADPLFLPTLTAEIAARTVDALGQPVLRFGSRLEVAGGLLIEVSQNCSGLSFFYSGCGLAVLCLSATRSWPRRAALVAAPYALTAVGNALRLVVLMVTGSAIGLDWKYTTPIHGILGTGVYLGVILGIWLVSDRRALREALT